MQSLSKNEKNVEDPQIVAWANSKVDGFSIDSFADSSLSTGVYLLQVGLLLFVMYRNVLGYLHSVRGVFPFPLLIWAIQTSVYLFV